MNTQIKRKGNTVIVKSPKAKDAGAWTEPNKKILKVVDNGNGFTVKHYSWLGSDPDMWYNIPYGLAGDLVDALAKFDYR